MSGSKILEALPWGRMSKSKARSGHPPCTVVFRSISHITKWVVGGGCRVGGGATVSFWPHSAVKEQLGAIGLVLGRRRLCLKWGAGGRVGSSIGLQDSAGEGWGTFGSRDDVGSL